MKNFYYCADGAKTQITFADGTVQELGKVNEFAFEFFPTKENTADLTKEPFYLNRDITLSFTVDFPKDFSDIWFDKSEGMDYLEQQKIYFRRIEIIIPNTYLNAREKKTWYEVQDKGYIFDVRFRQEIHPKLQAHVTFLTFLKVEAVENVD